MAFRAGYKFNEYALFILILFNILCAENDSI